MDPLSVTASIIAITKLSSEVLGYLTDVKNAPKDRRRCTPEVRNSHDLLVLLTDHLKGSSNVLWYDAVQTLGVENGPLDQFKEALEQLRKKMTGGSKVGGALKWKFSKEEVTSILGRIERLKTHVQAALEVDHFKLSQAIKGSTSVVHRNIESIKDDTGSIQTNIGTINSGVDGIRQGQNDAQHKELMNWISATNFPAQQSDFIARRHEGTGQWFCDAPEFKEWLHGLNQTLFCPGIPGAGKTMIAAIAVDHLLNMPSGAAGVAYVYCHYKAQDQNATVLLAAILKQLLQARPDLAEPVGRLHKRHADRGTKPSLEEISAAVQSVAVKYPSVYVVVDALDECSDRDGTLGLFLAKLRDLQSKTHLRIMATSRSIPGIVYEFSAALKLEIRASNADVKRFVAGQTYRLPKCIQRDNELQEMVQEKIMQAMDGMFLLARLYVDSLLDKRTKTQVKCTLKTLSGGSQALNRAYDDAIERIKGQLPGDKTLATDVLSWILHARRPLTTKELCHALAVRPGDKMLDQENVIDAEDVVSVCAGLVTVDEESGIIRLVHYTTQEYFQQVQEEWNSHAQLKIASTCLTYLSLNCFQSGSCPTEKLFTSRLEQNPFLSYAVDYWGIHIATVQEVCELACSFLQSDNLVSCAAQVMVDSKMSLLILTSQKNPIYKNGLHLTAQFELRFLSELLLSRLGMKVLKSDSEGGLNDGTTTTERTVATFTSLRL